MRAMHSRCQRFGSSPCFKSRLDGNPFSFSSDRFSTNLPELESRRTIVVFSSLCLEDFVCDIEPSAYCAEHYSHQQENVPAIEISLPHIVGDGIRISCIDYSAPK